MTEAAVGLADAVRAVRRELQAAMAEGTGQELRFTVGPVELEFEVEMTKSAGGGAKVYVLNGTIDRASTTTHHLKVTLTPLDASGKSPQVNGTLSAIPR